MTHSGGGVAAPSRMPIHAREGDNLAIHRALDDARPGDVLVINANGETNRAVFGDILGEICLAKGPPATSVLPSPAATSSATPATPSSATATAS